MVASLEELGYVPVCVRGYQMGEILGSGAHSIVYEATCDNEKDGLVAVKVFKRKTGDSCANEELVLKQLGNNIPSTISPFIPQVVCRSTTVRSKFSVLVLKPVGQKVVPLRGGSRLGRKHFVQLVDAVEYSHSKGIAHRDIKPENIFLVADTDNVLLNDWGCATVLNSCVEWRGTEYYYDRPNNMIGMATAAKDLQALVKSVHAIYCNQMPDFTSEYFAKCIEQSSYWKTVYDHAINVRYTELKIELLKL